ncbi:MAG: dCTP deaminase [Chloroflexi bacterium]|nr:dCTP deaminase [Chloroflexota bacterium]MBP8058171.1 dCTP deaminase [Chloroflexota bacterium]
MAIKSDRWIRKMALEHGMIEPFVENQVRQGVISYGVSSYGYDIRVADEFKIFTNVFSAIVDPKNFDPKSMVDFKGDVCIVPPNSFALARTVEYFRIPRSVLTICVGKSTYARCFRGDTRVALVDGTSPTLEEMAHRTEEGEIFWGYSISENGRVIVTLLEAPRYVGRDNLVELLLDNGQTIFCTPDHLFMLRDRQWQAAGELQPGTSLMPLYRSVQHGHEIVYQPLTGHLHPTQHLANEWNLRHGIHHKQALGFDPEVVYAKPRAHIPENSHTFSRQMTANNHKIISVRLLAGDHDVYCLTVPETGNFALEAGVFVHNCGIIVNVTPFEPEWEGYVTLEISNTTPLPAKIYANEGISQVLFFESDEVCETSYADRKGKYQSQKGIVLPKL